MIKRILSLGLLLCPLFLWGADRKASELIAITKLYLPDYIVVVTTNHSGAYLTNYTINYSNLLFNIRADAGGVITNNVGATSNSVTASITNLLTATISTNFLDSNGDSLWFSSAGNFANSTQAKSLFVALGGTTLFYSTNILYTTGNTNSWRLTGEIVRLATNSYVASVSLIPASLHSYVAGGTTNYSQTMTIVGSESLLTNNTLAIQTRGITAGDCTNHYLKLFNNPQF